MADLAKRPAGAPLLRRKRQHDRGPRTEYLAFALAGEPYAAPVSLVREILRPPPLTPVPRSPRDVIGIISVRGKLVTVIDLRRRLRLPESTPTRKGRVLLVDATGGETLGVYVDEVLQVHRLAESEIEPAASALGGEVASYIAGIARPALAPATDASKSHGRTEGHGGPEARDGSVIILLDLRAALA